jgi:uncharacterized protein YjbI with pentapeptide repeats
MQDCYYVSAIGNTETAPDMDVTRVLKRLGKGKKPERLSLRRTTDGLVDLRGISLDQPEVRGKLHMAGSVFDYTPGKPTFKKLLFERIDLSDSMLENSIWEHCIFRDVRFHKVKATGINFTTSNMDSVSFSEADLRLAAWGEESFDGPTLTNVEFVKSDLRKSMYGYPLFRKCRWNHSRLDGVDFRGSRFEDCVFVGLLDRVWFHGRSKVAEPSVSHLRNRMKNIDFSSATLESVDFSDGIDLTSCRLPTDGYMLIPKPRIVYQRALERVKALWSGEARKKGVYYFEVMLHHFPEEQPLYILRPIDLLESPLGREVASALIGELEQALRG